VIAGAKWGCHSQVGIDDGQALRLVESIGQAPWPFVGCPTLRFLVQRSILEAKAQVRGLFRVRVSGKHLPTRVPKRVPKRKGFCSLEMPLSCRYAAVWAVMSGVRFSYCRVDFAVWTAATAGRVGRGVRCGPVGTGVPVSADRWCLSSEMSRADVRLLLTTVVGTD
jgi:hypothetical protein